MNAEDFIRKELKAALTQGGADMAMINNAVEMCILEYRQRSSFKPDVMTYLLDKAKKLARKTKKKGK
ncbi:hypothetical protein [Pasteurella multocida]|uniref:hypothetical protein n=1 Tax=Pasteurella multocida TaxID=747 RepID=UPI000BBD37E4|nr:hypothetical protein [Pasteurella multocida]ATF73923.1 hypothetical protein CO688_00385 [Pasteurella multocida]ATN16325.1 hypothetical protein CRN72_00675 [Pasteurella multocida]MDY0489697.1 hypothetical protein [Pasteurella multocida]MDY0669963.1 hypothetical protein [Pasteurella multocida]MDY0721486.1 hypothetical protein [Pasteurella multocida]